MEPPGFIQHKRAMPSFEQFAIMHAASNALQQSHLDPCAW
jgi:hypothetical protein